MLESRPEDALVNTVENVETVDCTAVLTEHLKKYWKLTYSFSDSLKARNASASKNTLYLLHLP